MNTDCGIEIELDTLKIKGDATKLFEELAKAQLEFTPVPKSHTGQVGQQKFKYAGYASIMRCVRPALSKHGIAVIQPLHFVGDKAVTTTILAGHGACVQTSFAFDADFRRKLKDGTFAGDPQEFGRHHTYYRRYQLQSMLGIEGDADADDLPDVNEERAQFTEPAKEPEKKAPKAAVSADTKSASAEPTPTPSVLPSDSSTTTVKTNGKSKPKAEAKPEPEPDVTSTKTVNDLIAAGMEELGWKMPDVKTFFIEHVDPKGFDKAANLTVEQKQALFRKMVELKNVTPF